MFFETRCRTTENAEIVTFWPYCSLIENITIMFELSTTLSYRKLLFTLAWATSWCSLNQNVGCLSYCRSLKTGDSLWSIHTDAQKSHLLLTHVDQWNVTCCLFQDTVYNSADMWTGDKSYEALQESRQVYAWHWKGNKRHVEPKRKMYKLSCKYAL